MVGDAIIGESLSPPIGASGCCLNRIGLGRNSGGFQELANLHHLRLKQAVASEVQNHRVSVQCDAEPTLRFGVDFRDPLGFVPSGVLTSKCCVDEGSEPALFERARRKKKPSLTDMYRRDNGGVDGY